MVAAGVLLCFIVPLHAQLDVRQVVEEGVYKPTLEAPVLDSLRLMQQARRDVDSLCAPHMAGRGYTHEGHTLAARWLVQELRKTGLSPLCDGSYTQSFTLKVNVLQDARLVLLGQPLRLGYDFMPNGACPARGLTTGKAVYAGYARSGSLPAGKLAGKVVVLDADLPQGSREQTVSLYERIFALIRDARPAAIVVREVKLTHSYSQEQWPVPVFHVQADALPFPARVRKVQWAVQAQLREQEVTRNVAAYLPGTRRPDTLIVLGAHYDHLGRVGDATFHGASDNASGVAFLLSLARYFAQPGVEHPYSLAFLFFSAEEVGLLGSRHYVQHPCWPLSRTRAMYNFDLMANGSKGIMTVAGKDYPALYAPLAALNDSLQCIYPLQSRENRPNSDHYPFTQAGIPALFFYTQGGPPHYHDVHDLPGAYQLEAFWVFRKLFIHLLTRMQ
ncbi:MAG: M28 family peptidase [Bacteroidetes bacterium]|nr:M28 family peptidase [Bacteroidota bacterium]